MFVVALLIIAGLVFYAFIALGPAQVIQAALALTWVMLILSIPVSLAVELMR